MHGNGQRNRRIKLGPYQANRLTGRICCGLRPWPSANLPFGQTSYTHVTLCEMFGNIMMEYKGDHYESSTI